MSIEQIMISGFTLSFVLMGILLRLMYQGFDRIDKKFDKVDLEFRGVREEFKEVREELKELRTSINRMEGAFYSKDCCMLKDDKQNKKAE